MHCCCLEDIVLLPERSVFVPVAQLVERCTNTAEVGGSIPGESVT